MSIMKGKRGARRAPRRGRKAQRKSQGLVKSDVAQVVANLATVTIGANQTVGAYNFALSNSDRARAVAQAYQYYRIRKVTMKVKPLFDTYATGGGAGAPNLYYVVDKARTFQLNSSLAALKSAGAKPHRIDDKVYTTTFRPAVTLLDVSSASPTPGINPTLQPGQTRVSPWLTTNANANVSFGTAPWVANSVDHAGIIMAFEQWGTSPTSGPIATVEFMVEYEFKGKLWVNPNQNEPTREINLDTGEFIIVDPELPKDTPLAA